MPLAIPMRWLWEMDVTSPMASGPTKEVAVAGHGIDAKEFIEHGRRGEFPHERAAGGQTAGDKSCREHLRDAEHDVGNGGEHAAVVVQRRG